MRAGIASGATASAAPSSAIACGARGSIAAIVCGSMAALVSAWGVPAMRTIVWQSTWCSA